jgi:hypothetical protein
MPSISILRYIVLFIVVLTCSAIAGGGEQQHQQKQVVVTRQNVVSFCTIKIHFCNHLSAHFSAGKKLSRNCCNIRGCGNLPAMLRDEVPGCFALSQWPG